MHVSFKTVDSTVMFSTLWLPKNLGSSQMVVVHTFNLSTREAEAGGSRSLRPAWSIEEVSGQPGLRKLSTEKLCLKKVSLE